MTDFLYVLKFRKNRYRKQWFSNFLRGSKKIFSVLAFGGALPLGTSSVAPEKAKMQGFRGGSEATDKQALPQGRKCRENNTPQALAASSRAHTSLEEKPWSPHFTGREN